MHFGQATTHHAASSEATSEKQADKKWVFLEPARGL